MADLLVFMKAKSQIDLGLPRKMLLRKTDSGDAWHLEWNSELGEWFYPEWEIRVFYDYEPVGWKKHIVRNWRIYLWAVAVISALLTALYP